MSLQYTDLSAPAPDTVTVFGGLGSNTTVFAQTPDEIQLAVSDDTVTLVATGRVAAGNDVLASIGKNDSLWTDGATRMSFLNEGTNTSDIIQATGGPAQQSFLDSAVDFKVGDRLLVFGYTGTPKSSPAISSRSHRNRIWSLVRVEHRLYGRRRPHRACRIQHASRPTYAHPSCIDWIC